MAFYGYSLDFDSSKSARAQGYDINASYKDLTQVCQAIEGKPYAKAVKVLEGAIDLTMPIVFKRHATGVGHRSQLGGKKGRFPKNESKYTLALLKNAYANAQSKGLDEKTLVVVHAAAYKQNEYPRYRRFFASSNILGYGKHSSRSDYGTARIELVLGEKGLKPMKKLTRAQQALAKQKKKAEKKAALAKVESKSKAEAKAQVKSDSKPEAKAESKPKVEKKESGAHDGHDHSHAGHDHEGHKH